MNIFSLLEGVALVALEGSLPESLPGLTYLHTQRPQPLLTKPVVFQVNIFMLSSVCSRQEQRGPLDIPSRRKQSWLILEHSHVCFKFI